MADVHPPKLAHWRSLAREFDILLTKLLFLHRQNARGLPTTTRPPFSFSFFRQRSATPRCV